MTQLIKDERGSVTIWIVLSVTAMMLVVGLVVDGAGKVYAMQRARDVANQAARVAGQQVVAADAMRGEKVRIDTSAAAQAARRYLAAAGVRGNVTFTSPNTLRVHVTDTYQPVYLGALGFGTMSVEGEATAYLARAVNGQER